MAAGHHGAPQWRYSAVQNQKAVAAYFTSKQLLPFGFAEQYYCHRTGRELNLFPISEYTVILSAYMDSISGHVACVVEGHLIMAMPFRLRLSHHGVWHSTFGGKATLASRWSFYSGYDCNDITFPVGRLLWQCDLTVVLDVSRWCICGGTILFHSVRYFSLKMPQWRCSFHGVGWWLILAISFLIVFNKKMQPTCHAFIEIK